MKILRGLAVKVAVLVVAMLAAIGGWEIYKGTVAPPAQAQAALDHFKCYNIVPKTSVNKRVLLTNQFGSEEVTVKNNLMLCVPTSKQLLP